MHFKEIKYGFEYGSCAITRITSDEKKGWITLGLKTQKYQVGSPITNETIPTMQIYVTKTGKVRIYDQYGEWTPPSKVPV